MYTFEDLKNDVAAEAKALREHATKEELGWLQFGKLKPNHRQLCVYGQMCDACDSPRAVELILKCAPVFLRLGDSAYFPSNRSKVTDRFTPIEAYILLPEAKNANLIAYLKGETETLEL